MKIERFLDGAIAADGGTIACRVALDDGTVLDLGLDSRIPKKKAERLVFINASMLDQGWRWLHGFCQRFNLFCPVLRAMAIH